MSQGEYPDAWTPATTDNMDVKSLVEDYDRAVFEMVNSNSAALQGLNTFDISRIQAYSAAIRAETERINASGPRDLVYLGPVLPFVFSPLELTRKR
jgi:hypothetical protein